MFINLIKILFLSLLSIFVSFSTVAQQKNLPLHKAFYLDIEQRLNQSDTLIHTAFKPLNEQVLGGYGKLTHSKDSLKRKSFIYRKLKQESLIWFDTVNFHLSIDPLFHFELGQDMKDTSRSKLYKNTRGVLVKGDITSKFSFESSFYENQSRFVKYIDDYIDTFQVVPGQGRVKTFKNNAFDYAMASGYVSYAPNRYFNFQAGHGKHFVGEGYRSLLLSDNPFNYPYFRSTITFNKFQYTNLYTSLMNLSDGGVITPLYSERLFQKKSGSFKFLSWNIHKRIQLGFFEGIIWEASDNKNKQRLNFFYFNPLPLISIVKYSLSHTNNVLLGSTLKIKASKRISLYGQYVMDDLAQKGSVKNKQAYQLGVRWIDPFNIRNFSIQTEYNQVRPYTYAHQKQQQNYSHYNQSLAHPLGANFKEAVALITYRFLKDFFVDLKLSYATLGADSAGTNYGTNIFESDIYGAARVNVQGQGVKTTITHETFEIGYRINPVTNMNVLLGVSNRLHAYPGVKNATQFFYFSLKTSLLSLYYDF